MIGRRRPRPGPAAEGPRRRRGPAGEERWWDADDQVLAERVLLAAADLGRGWREVPMLNNAERLDPLGEDPASEAVRAERRRRRLTALDEGRAWRHRDQGLAVLRSEVFADADDAPHRACWQRSGEAALDATWRQRWRERDRTPGWIEARLVPPAERPDPLHAFVDAEPQGVAAAVDWFRIEDHTDTSGDGAVTVYEHLTVWRGRCHAVLTVRHDLGLDLDDVTAAAAATIFVRLGAPGA